MPQQWPELLRIQRCILNPLCHSVNSLHIFQSANMMSFYLFSSNFFFFFVFLPFFWPLPQHMEVPRLGVQSEL